MMSTRILCTDIAVYNSKLSFVSLHQEKKFSFLGPDNTIRNRGKGNSG